MVSSKFWSDKVAFVAEKNGSKSRVERRWGERNTGGFKSLKKIQLEMFFSGEGSARKTLHTCLVRLKPNFAVAFRFCFKKKCHSRPLFSLVCNKQIDLMWKNCQQRGANPRISWAWSDCSANCATSPATGCIQWYSFGLGTILGNERCNPGLGRGGGLEVSVLAFYSEDSEFLKFQYEKTKVKNP